MRTMVRPSVCMALHVVVLSATLVACGAEGGSADPRTSRSVSASTSNTAGNAASAPPVGTTTASAASSNAPVTSSTASTAASTGTPSASSSATTASSAAVGTAVATTARANATSVECHGQR